MVGQSHDSFTPVGVKDVMLFKHFQQALNPFTAMETKRIRIPVCRSKF
jgi:hypothetical protein